MITETLVKLLMQSPRATEQELLDEVNRVEKLYNSLKQVHDATNMVVKSREEMIEALETDLDQLRKEKSQLQQQKAAQDKTISMLAASASNGSTEK